MIHYSREIDGLAGNTFTIHGRGLSGDSSEDYQDEKRCAPHNRSNGVFRIRIPDQWYPCNHCGFFHPRTFRSCCQFSHAGYPGGTDQFETQEDLPQQTGTKMYGNNVRHYSGNRVVIITAYIEQSSHLWFFLFCPGVFLPSSGRFHNKKGTPGIKRRKAVIFQINMPLPGQNKTGKNR